MKRRMTFPRSAKTYRPFSLTVSNCLFSLPPHSHQFGRLLLQEFTALLWHTVYAHSPPVLEYLESLKTVSRPLIFCSSTSRCFPKPFCKRLISVELCTSYIPCFLFKCINTKHKKQIWIEKPISVFVIFTTASFIWKCTNYSRQVCETRAVR